MPLLEIKNLHAGYGELKVLTDVNLELEKGKMSVLMGPNGAGKSTLIKSIFNITNVTSGDIFFEGKLRNSISERQSSHGSSTHKRQGLYKK